MRTYSFLLLLASIALIKRSMSQAPLDYDNICRTNFRFANDHIFPENWKILLDSYDYQNLIGTVWEPVDADQDGLNWQQSGGICQFSLRACTFSAEQDQDNWLFTQYVSYEEAQEVLFDIDFRFTQCTNNPNCLDDFARLHIYEVTSILDSVSRFDQSNYKLLRVLQQEGSSNTNLQFSILRSSDSNINGFYLAFEDVGTCGQIERLLTYHLRAPGFIDSDNLVTCPDTALPPSGTTRLTTSSCTCDLNAVSTASLERSCDASGVCSGSPSCACKPGYELSTDGTCTLCPAGTFKATASNTERCTPCPANSASVFGGAAICTCDCNTVRPADQPGADCGRPPSSPIVANGMSPVYDGSQGITIFWYPAQQSGGNPEEIHYNVYSYNSAEKVYIKENTDNIEANSDSDLIEYTISNDLSTLSLIVTSASTTTGDEEVISDLSQVQNRFILFYVSFDKQITDITIDLDDITTTEATSDATTEPTEVTSTITDKEDMVTDREDTEDTTIDTEDTTTIDTEDTTIDTEDTVTDAITEAATTQNPLISEEVQVPNLINNVISPPEVSEVIIIIENEPPPPSTNLHFTLGGQKFLNGSTVPLSNIGEGENALLCVTDNVGCCRAGLEGEFYYPDNSQVPVRAAGASVYRNRGEGFIRLNSIPNRSAPLGQYRCAIPDATDKFQNIFVTITQ